MAEEFPQRWFISAMMGLIFLAIGIVCLFSEKGEWLRHQELVSQGVRAEATITNVGERAKATHVDLTFADKQGITHTVGGEQVSGTLYLGRITSIVHVPSNPDIISELPLGNGYKLPWIAAAASGVPGLILLFRGCPLWRTSTDQ